MTDPEFIEQPISHPKPATKQGKGVYVFMALMACALAYIVTKDIEISPFWIAVGAVLGGIILLVKGIGNPEIVMYALVAYLPFSKVLAGDFGGLATAFNFTNLLMLFIMFVWFTGKLSMKEPLWLPSALNLPIFIFMIVGLIAVVRGVYFGTGYIHYSVVEYKRWITPIVLYFLVLNTVKERAAIQNIVVIMCIVTTVVGLMAIYDYFDLGDVGSLERARIGGIADQPNMLAAFFNYYMFLPFGFFLMNLKRAKYWLLLIPFLICFRGIMVTFSRGGYLAFALGLYAITFFRSKGTFFAMILITVLTVLNPFFLPAGIQYRMGQTFAKHNSQIIESASDLEGSVDQSSRARMEVWKGGIQMTLEHPVFGVGYGLFQPMVALYWSEHRPIDAHNTYLIIAAEMGIPALLIFLWIIWIVFKNTFFLYRTTRDPFAKATALGFLGGLFGLLMSNMFGSRLDSQEVSSYFWILAALMVRLQILDRRAQEENPSGPVLLESSPPRKLDACWNE